MLTAVIGAVAGWAGWLPHAGWLALAVVAAGAAQLGTMWATRQPAAFHAIPRRFAC